MHILTLRSIAIFAVAVICLVTQASGESPKATHKWTYKDDRFMGPESVWYDAQSEAIYVSNINGKSIEKDGNGFISKLSSDGKLIDLTWADGLNAPKGLVTYEGQLYVTDIDQLVVIDINEPKRIRRIDVPGAVYLNDVVVTERGAFLTDSRQGTVYQVINGLSGKLAEHQDIARQNGITVMGKGLVFAAGHAQEESPNNNRFLWTVSYDGKIGTMHTQPKRLGKLDGLSPDGRGGLLMSDKKAGRILHMDASGVVNTIAEPGAGAADISYSIDQRLLLVPIMGKQTRIVAFDID